VSGAAASGVPVSDVPVSDVPVSWVTLFVLVSYLMGLACLCLAFRIGSAGGNWVRGIREVVVFLSF
jgi:hypothetical protein